MSDESQEKKLTNLEEVNRNVLEIRELLEFGNQAIAKYTDMKTTESNNTLKTEMHRTDTQFKMFWVDRALFMLIVVAVIVLGIFDKIPLEFVWSILLITGGYLLRNEISKKIQGE